MANTLRTVIEASALGLRPGFFPGVLDYGGKVYQLTSVERDADNDVAFVTYYHGGLAKGQPLVVLND